MAASILVPSLAVGGPVEDLLSGVNDTVSGVTGGAAGGGGVAGGTAADDRAGVPPGGYQPPLHGGNPHGQGTVAAVDLLPSNNNPYPADPADGDEEIVIGDSRGEQNGTTYHGRVSLLHVNLLGLINDDIGIETNPGQTNNDPGPLQTQLDTICTSSGNNLCLSVMAMNSSTSTTGSNNSFDAATAQVGNGAITANVAQSSGNINEAGGCQTADGTSSITNGNVGPFTFDVLSGSSSSTACNTGQQSTTQSSSVVNLAGGRVPIPTPGCGGGVPDSEFNALIPLVGIVCNADDSNQGQTTAPYGVRESLTTFALIFGNTSLLKVTASGPESHAVAPPVTPTTPTTPTTPGAPGGPGKRGTAGEADQGGGGEEGPGSAAAEAGSGGGTLAFTGANLLLLGIIGACLIGMGLTMTARRRRIV